MLHWLQFLDLISDLLFDIWSLTFLFYFIKDYYLAHKQIRDSQETKKDGHNEA